MFSDRKGRIWLPGALTQFAPLENDASVIICVVPCDRLQPLVAAGPLFLSESRQYEAPPPFYNKFLDYYLFFWRCFGWK